MQLKTPGGIERFVSTLATMLTNDFTIEIIANYGKKSDQLAFPLPKNVKVTFLSPTQPQEVSMKNLIKNLKWHQIPSELHRRHKINRTRNKAFCSFLKNYKTDYIITDRALYNSLVGKYYHGTAPKIATDHNHHQNNAKYIKKLSDSLKNFAALVVPSKELQTFYQSKFPFIKCFFIPIPLNFIPSQKSPLNTKNILSVGRLVPEKDFSFLINVMSIIHQENPAIHLTIIGDGTEKAKLQNLIQTKQLNSCITLTGWLPQNQIAKYYHNSSLFVMTSKTEAFGLVLTEAMSYGLPCLALSRASGAHAQITPKTGILIDNPSPLIMANEIINLINHPQILKTYQTNINRSIHQHKPATIVKQWLNIFSMLPKSD